VLRLVLGFALILVLAFAAAWLADQPGEISLRWGGYEITASVLVGAVALAILVVLATLIWRSYTWLTGAPGAIGDWFHNRGRRKGFEALSHGLIAAGAGDTDAAAREVAAAEKYLGGAPLTLLLKAQTAQLRGEPAAARSAYETMLDMPETESLGLRGLYLEARRVGDKDRAQTLAMRAVKLKPSMGWASEALFELQAAAKDWAGARQTLELRRRHRHIDRRADARARAVILTAEAQSAEDNNAADKTLEAALAAHKLAPELVPAAAMAGRILAERGETGRATKLVEKTWRLSPHPDLAVIYAHARPGDSTQDRLVRARALAGKSTVNAADSPEGPIAIARAAIEAREWETARQAVRPMVEAQASRRICMIMAEIENGEHGDRGRVREWLARAVSAPRDPAWTADGHVSDHWLPVSPETGKFDVYEWRVPIKGTLSPAEDTLKALTLDEMDAAPAMVTHLDETPAVEIEAAAAEPTATGAVDGAVVKPEEESKTSTGNARAEEAGTVFIAPIPDDPGVEGDDFDGPKPKPKDIGG